MKKATVTALIFGLLISPSLALNSSFSSGSSQSLSTIVQALTEESWLDVADTSWYDASATEFTISTAEQLAGLAKLVNNGTDNFEDKVIKLTANISLGDYQWIAIGNFDNPFKGTFYGNDNTIDNMFIEQGDNEEDFVGLFGIVENAIIEGVIIGENSYVKSANAAGGICSWAKGSTIINNCINKAEITSDNENDLVSAGGIVGEVACIVPDELKVKIINCINEGAIYAAGYELDSEEFNGAGGIVGCCVGEINSRLQAEISIINCINTGEVVANGQAGGICGYAYDQDVTISNSINIGEISAPNNAGGIAGLKLNSVIILDETYYIEGCVTKNGSECNRAIGCITITKNNLALSEDEAADKAAEIIQAIEENLAEDAVKENLAEDAVKENLAEDAVKDEN